MSWFWLLLLTIAQAAELPPVIAESMALSRKAAAQALEAEAQRTADADAAAWILLYAGEMRRLGGEPEAARRHFERVAGDFPQSPARDPAKLGLAVVDAEGMAGGNVLATLELIADEGVPDTLNAERYLLRAQAAGRAQAPEGEVAALVKKARYYGNRDREMSRRVARATQGMSEDVPTPPKSDVPPDLEAIEAIRAALVAEDAADAARRAKEFPTTFPGSPFTREAAYALRRAEKGVRTDPKRVVVLLPLTGEYATVGANLKLAVTLANEDTGSRATLVFRDTAGNGDTCVSLLEKAVIDEGAAYAIGPLTRQEALVCAPAAQALRVPMLALSSAVEIAAAGDLVYRPFPSTEELVEALLDEVQARRGLQRYAVLHPKTTYGENAARVFAAAVGKRGGTVVQTLSYDADATDFRPVARQLGAKDYKTRAEEFARLKAQARARGGDPDKVVLPPVVDYDAIFIPDNYQRVALLASALAFEEFPVGSFRPRVGDIPLPLLGLNAWNNDELARRGGKYVLDSIFVDAFDVRATDAATQRFVDRWRDHQSSDPSVVEAVGYDTMRLVSAAIGLGKPLGAVTLENGVAGTKRFADDRHCERSWRLLTVTREGILSLEAAEAAAQEPTAPL